jgi:hypothetical protein
MLFQDWAYFICPPQSATTIFFFLSLVLTKLEEMDEVQERAPPIQAGV